jgi:acyl carrier protein
MATVTADSVEQTVYDALAEMGADRVRFSREATFEDLDVDSLDLVELAQVIEDEYGVALEGDDVKDLKTLGEAIDLVVSRAPAAKREDSS